MNEPVWRSSNVISYYYYLLPKALDVESTVTHSNGANTTLKCLILGSNLRLEFQCE